MAATNALFNPFGVSCIAAAAAGVLSHLMYFIRGYHDSSAPWIFSFYATAGALVSYHCMREWGISLLTIRAAVMLSMSYFVALFISIATYRLAFHPLRRFPGPLIARLSKTLYGPYLNRDGKLHLEHTRLHEKYGDFLRVGPNELYILSTDALTKIHGPNSRCTKKGTMYEAIQLRGERNIDAMVDPDAHRWRKQAWEKSLATTKVLNQYEPFIRQVVHEWLEKIGSLGGEAIDTSLFMLLITLDIIGYVGFSKRLGSVAEGESGILLHTLGQLFAAVGALGMLTWPIFLAESIGIRGKAALFDEVVAKMTDEKEKNPGHDVMQYFLDDYHSEKPKVFHNRNILLADAEAILTGGTETAGGALAFAMAYLSKYPDIQEKVRQDVHSHFGETISGEFSSHDLESAEYLNAVIQETMRLHNPAVNGGQRMTPPEGIEVDGVHIPGGVLVVTPSYTMQRSKKFFERPLEFIPERWTTQPELIIDQKAYNPFIQGSRYGCVGRHLALRMMRLVIAYTVYHYNVKLAPDEDGEAIDREALNWLILHAGPCKCVFQKREDA